MRKHSLYFGYKLISVLLVIMFMACSCSVTKQLGPRSERKVVASHMQQSDHKALVLDYSRYPRQQSLIVEYLINTSSYSGYNYRDIKFMRDSFSEDDVLWEFFDNILAEKEDAIQTKLEEMSIEEISEYYVKHPEESSYLTPFLKQTILPALDSADFLYVRHIHKLFDNTDLTSAIDKIYIPFKNEVWKDISEYLDEYFEMEKEVVSTLRGNIDDQVYGYIDEGFQKVINACVEKEKLPWGKNEVIAFADEQLDRYLPEEKIFKIVKRAIEQYSADFEVVRTDVVNEILQETMLDTTYNVSQDMIYTVGENFKPIYEHIISVSNIQHKINWTSWGLTVAGFIPYVGIAADIADIIYSRRFDEQKVIDINNNMSDFSSDIYDGYVSWYEEYIADVIYSFEKEVNASQVRMKNLLYENL